MAHTKQSEAFALKRRATSGDWWPSFELPAFPKQPTDKRFEEEAVVTAFAPIEESSDE